MREVAQAREGALQDRAERLELGAVGLEIARDVARITRVDLRHLRGQPIDIRRGVDGAPVVELKPVHRVEPDQLDLLVEVVTAGGEYLARDLRIEKEGRADIEGVSVAPDRPRAPARLILFFEKRHLGPRRAQQHRGGEPAGARADHQHLLAGRLAHRGQPSRDPGSAVHDQTPRRARRAGARPACREWIAKHCCVSTICVILSVTAP